MAKAKKLGRPRKPLDEKRAERLAMDGCSNRDIAAMLGVDEKVIRNHLSATLHKKRALRRWGIHKDQDRLRKKLNATMLIWQGKQELGQTDKQELEHTGEVKTITTLKVSFDE